MTGDARREPRMAHATCVAAPLCEDPARWAGVLIFGPSGAGKSTLGLHMIALGARLVADDQTELRRSGGDVVARGPSRLSGLIEARGVGLLRARPLESVPVRLIVELVPSDRPEGPRLPDRRNAYLLDVPVPVLSGAESARTAAIAFAVASGRAAFAAEAGAEPRWDTPAPIGG